MSWRVRLNGRVGALDLDVSIEVDAPLLLMVGPNGSGKSTVLRALAGASLPVHGRVEIGGRTLMDQKTAMSPQARRVGFVPQSAALFEHLDVRRNVRFAAARTSDPETQTQTSIARLGLASLQERRPSELSGGEKQRVALARAIASAPAFLLLDEPLSAQDVPRRRQTRQLLRTLLDELSIPTLVVTHDVRDLQAMEGTVLVLEAGSVVQSGALKTLIDAPATPYVEELVAPLAG